MCNGLLGQTLLHYIKKKGASGLFAIMAIVLFHLFFAGAQKPKQDPCSKHFLTNQK